MQKNIIELLFKTMMIALLAIGFTACSDDDDDSPKSNGIEGTWNASTDDDEMIIYSFGTDKKGKYINSETGENTEFTWTSTENTITITDSNGRVETKYYRIKNGKLCLYDNFEDYENDEPEISMSDSNTSASKKLAGTWIFSNDNGEFEAALTLNQDNSYTIYEEENKDMWWTSYVGLSGIWLTPTDYTMSLLSSENYGNHKTYFYYRFKGDKLYLYSDRDDYDFDDPQYIGVKGKKPGNDDDEPSVNPGGNVSALLGTWEISTYMDGDYYTESFTFRKDGKVDIKGTVRNHPEYNYSITNQYSVEGSFDKGARLTIWGTDADGDKLTIKYLATIDGKSLILQVIEHSDDEGIGEVRIMKRK